MQERLPGTSFLRRLWRTPGHVSAEYLATDLVQHAHAEPVFRRPNGPGTRQLVGNGPSGFGAGEFGGPDVQLLPLRGGTAIGHHSESAQVRHVLPGFDGIGLCLPTLLLFHYGQVPDARSKWGGLGYYEPSKLE